MQISQNPWAAVVPNLYASARKPEADLRLESAQLPVTRENHDLLEISDAGRQLAEGAIEHRPARRVEIPDKPQGAPNDYVNPAEWMKRVDPERYGKFQEALENGGDWSRLLVQFVQQAQKHPEWVSTYLAERNRQSG
ncbi:hypothetical protein [Cohnella caldifontis]|uniref:hypothetical protein n=1 Tax=Cohnella caldifontis TaxID=3027471 RepID=UPI0023ED18E8|nr:hypothetical protein [Cohnella sp. YIM B05605]